MKKILIYTENYDYGGLERFLFDFIIAYKNNKVLLIFNKENKRILDFAQEFNIEYIPANITNIRITPFSNNIIIRSISNISNILLKYYNLIINYFYLKNLFKALTAYDNLFIINGGYPAATSCISAIFAGKKNNIKNIVMSVLSCPIKIFNIPLINSLENYIDKQVNKDIDIIQPNARNIIKDFEKYRKNIDISKMRVVHTGVSLPDNTDKINQIKNNDILIMKQKGEVWVGMVAFLGSTKAQDVIIDAMGIVNKKYNNVKCLIVGSGPKYKALAEQSINLDLSDKVIFLGKYPNENIGDIYKFLDICIFSSDHEGFPYAISEAMSYKLPVIATNISGIPEQIEDGVNGFLVDKQNPQQIAEKLIFLIENRQKWNEFGIISHDKIKEHFSINAMVKKLDKLFY